MFYIDFTSISVLLFPHHFFIGETYVLKQQGHSNNMSCIAYSTDGQLIATGGEDGKVKLWNLHSGFCFITFHEHTSAISSIVFSGNKKFVVSASLDGTVRAFDVLRYRISNSYWLVKNHISH